MAGVKQLVLMPGDKVMPAEGLVVNGPGGHDARGNVRLHQFFRQKGHPQARVHGLYDGVGADRFPGGLYVEIVQGENVVQKGAARAARFPQQEAAIL